MKKSSMKIVLCIGLLVSTQVSQAGYLVGLAVYWTTKAVGYGTAITFGAAAVTNPAIAVALGTTPVIPGTIVCIETGAAAAATAAAIATPFLP